MLVADPTEIRGGVATISDSFFPFPPTPYKQSPRSFFSSPPPTMTPRPLAHRDSHCSLERQDNVSTVDLARRTPRDREKSGVQARVPSKEQSYQKPLTVTYTGSSPPSPVHVLFANEVTGTAAVMDDTLGSDAVGPTPAAIVSSSGHRPTNVKITVSDSVPEILSFNVLGGPLTAGEQGKIRFLLFKSTIIPSPPSFTRRRSFTMECARQ